MLPICRLLVPISLLVSVVVLVVLGSCDRTPADDPATPQDSVPIGEIVGKYYGYATGDFYTQNIRRNYLVTITVRPGADPDTSSLCNCVIWIDIGDSLGTLATVCAGGPSERLESDCRNGEFHDVFLGVADRMRISGELESYHAPRDSSEYRWCTLAFHATRR